MNCNRFRFLVQQNFDTELSAQDEQSLFDHIDSCQSCSRFQHQIDQVIQAAIEMPLPEEAVPSNLESLARIVMQQLPQQKSSVFGMFGGLFGGGGGKQKAEPKQKPQKQQKQGRDQQGRDPQERSSAFPHVKRQKGGAPAAEEEPVGKQTGGQKITGGQQKSTGPKKAINMDDQQATSMRLKSMSRFKDKEPVQSAEEQSETGTRRGLGAKFGMQIPGGKEEQAAEGPANLADQIRRKLMEERQTNDVPAVDEAAAAGWPQDGSFNAQPGAPGAEGWGQQPAAGWGQQQQQGGWEQQGAPPQGGGWEQQGAPPQGGGWEQQGAPPQGGGWEQPGQQQQAGWGQQPPQQQGNWGEQPQTPPAADPWGQQQPQQANDAWGQQQQQQQQAAWGQPQPSADAWGQQPQQQQPAADPWGQAAQGQPVSWDQQQQPQGGDGWNTPGQQQADGWGQQPQQPAQPQQAGWGQEQSSGWGQPQAGQGSNWEGGWDEPPVETGFVKDLPQQPEDGWTTPGQPAAWGNTTATPAPPQQADSGGWGQQPQPAAAQGGGWNEDAEQIQTGMWQAFTPGDGSLGAKAPAAQAPAPGPAPAAPTADRWDVPIQERMAQQAAGAAPAAPSPVAAAPAAAEDRWDVPIQERMRMQAGGAAAPAPAAAPAVNANGLPVDSIMNRLSHVLGDDPGAAPAAEPQLQTPAPAPAAAPAEDRWDVPIQERMAQQAAAAAAPAPAAPAAPAEDRWDVPIQERLRQQQSGQQPAAAAPPAPPPAPPPPAPAAPAGGGAEDARWDVPIQERMRQQQGGAAPASAPQDQGGGLFKTLDDNAMDKLFGDNLGINEGTSPKPAAAAPSAPPPPPVPAPSVAPPAPPVPPPAPAAAPVPPSPMALAASFAPPPAPAPAAPAQPAGGGLFNLDDNAMDKLFGENLGVNDPASARPAAPAAAAAPVPPSPVPPSPLASAPPPPPPPPQPAAAQGGWSQPAPTVVPPPPPTPAPAAAQPQGGGLFNLDDNAMDKLFGDNLGVQEQPQQPRINVQQAVQAVREAAPSASAPPPPAPGPAPANAPAAQPAKKIEGMGRLDSKGDNSGDTGSGKIAAIGKFLLDQQDLGKIGQIANSDLSDTKLRILTLEAAQELQNLLQHIGQQPGVVGSVIVGHDGILIANGMPPSMDGESTGIWALGVYLNTDGVIKKMGHNHIHQVVARTPQGYIIIADFGGGILVTVSQGSETDKLIPLMRSITQLVSQ